MSAEVLKVRSLLDASKRKLLDVEKQAHALRAEIAAYEKVCAILNNGGGGAPPTAAQTRVLGDGSPQRRSRGISETWRRVFTWIGDQASAPETEDVWKFTVEAGLDVARPTLRSQLSVYTEKGLLERYDSGYRLSDSGRALLFGNGSDNADESDEPEVQLDPVHDL